MAGILLLIWQRPVRSRFLKIGAGSWYFENKQFAVTAKRTNTEPLKL